MATLAEILRQTGYSQGGTLATPKPVESPMTNAIASYLQETGNKFNENQANMQKMVGGWNKTDFATGLPNPNYYPEAIDEVTNLMNIGGLTAWHGTPHKIANKFDISKVGTGEGAQSYGHGMYFAEEPKVAKEYQRALSGRTDLGQQPSDPAFIHAVESFREVGTPLDKIPAEMKKAYKSVTDKDIQLAIQATEKGNLYKVDIPDEHIPLMLDYDKPIKNQPEIYELIKSRFTDPDLLKTFENNAASGISGANVYKNYIGGKTDKERSENALALGIKGIRYLDEGSRASKITKTPIAQLDAKIDILKKDLDSGLGNKEVMERRLKVLQDERARTTKQTSNFVVFDPSTVKILEENSKPVSRKEIIEKQVKALKD
jgi:hypothetical protein